jgi:hypothetical protein
MCVCEGCIRRHIIAFYHLEREEAGYHGRVESISCGVPSSIDEDVTALLLFSFELKQF